MDSGMHLAIILRYLNWPVRMGVLAYGITGLLCMILVKEFTSWVYLFAWLTWIFGIPAAFIVGTLTFCCMWPFLFWGRKKEPKNPDKDFKKAQHKITIAWICGSIASAAAIFANINPFGPSRDFTLINFLDAGITGFLTWCIYRRCTVFLFTGDIGTVIDNGLERAGSVVLEEILEIWPV